MTTYGVEYGGEFISPVDASEIEAIIERFYGIPDVKTVDASYSPDTREISFLVGVEVNAVGLSEKDIAVGIVADTITSHFERKSMEIAAPRTHVELLASC